MPSIQAEFLVSSINGLTEQHPEISVEWVGLILLPIVGNAGLFVLWRFDLVFPATPLNRFSFWCPAQLNMLQASLSFLAESTSCKQLTLTTIQKALTVAVKVRFLLSLQFNPADTSLAFLQDKLDLSMGVAVGSSIQISRTPHD